MSAWFPAASSSAPSQRFAPAATHQSSGFIIGVGSETRQTQKVSNRNDVLVLRQSGLDIGEIRREEVGGEGGFS